MPQVIRCPHCTKAMQVPDNAAGKQVRCPGCSRLFLVSSPALAKQPVAAAAPTAKSSSGSVQIDLAPRPAPPPPAKGPATPAPPSAAPTECPACKSPLLPGAISCMDCGYLLQTEAPGTFGGNWTRLLPYVIAFGVALFVIVLAASRIGKQPLNKERS